MATTTMKLEAEIRKEIGKAASRRSRLANKVPATLYGGHKAACSLFLLHHKVQKALEHENIYSSVLDLKVNGKIEHVILKDLQRHPYKPIILHMDFQRVGAKDVIVKAIPIHFINEQLCQGVKAGGVIAHNMTQVEVRCQVQNLPEFLAVDLTDVMIDTVLHLADLELPSGVQIASDLTDSNYNLPVVSVRHPRVVTTVEEEVKEQAQVEASEVENKE